MPQATAAASRLMDPLGSHRVINYSDSESVGSRIESSSGFEDASSSALSESVLPAGQPRAAEQPAEGAHLFLADSASNGGSSWHPSSGFEESSGASAGASALDHQGRSPVCERGCCVMQISDLFPDIVRVRPHYLCGRCGGSSQQGHLAGSPRRWTCPRCWSDTCLQCYPEEPMSEPAASAAARPGVRLETGGDGEEEQQEGTLAEEDLAKSSKGSAKHFAGTCRPCLYINTREGCSNGSDCNFCHVAHKRNRRTRPSKALRTQCKLLAAMLQSEVGEDDPQLMEAANKLAADSAYMRSILAATAKARQDPAQAEEAPAGWDQAAQGGAASSWEPQPLEQAEPQSAPAHWPAQRRGGLDPDGASPAVAPSGKQRAAGARQKTDRGAASASSGHPRRH